MPWCYHDFNDLLCMTHDALANMRSRADYLRTLVIRATLGPCRAYPGD